MSAAIKRSNFLPECTGQKQWHFFFLSRHPQDQNNQLCLEVGFFQPDRKNISAALKAATWIQYFFFFLQALFFHEGDFCFQKFKAMLLGCPLSNVSAPSRGLISHDPFIPENAYLISFPAQLREWVIDGRNMAEFVMAWHTRISICDTFPHKN